MEVGIREHLNGSSSLHVSVYVVYRYSPLSKNNSKVQTGRQWQLGKERKCAMCIERGSEEGTEMQRAAERARACVCVGLRSKCCE